jgi:putative SOS response-associated peptidase YedK
MRRCALVTPIDTVAEEFGAEIADGARQAVRPNRDLGPPGVVVGIRLVDGRRVLDAYRWGFTPPWARRLYPESYEAHIDTMASRATFAEAFRSARLVFVADAFYLWHQTHGKHTGYVFRRPDGTPLALAGLWSPWRDRNSTEVVQTCAVITGPANIDVLPVSYRMPIDLARDQIDAWLDPELHDVDTLQEMLRLLPPGSYRRSRMRGSATRRKTL